ncbi:MAG: hypothetical protein OEV23_06745, partial [Gallionella sp.]|nr:hypothetical protein [Gallionella sp.]
RRHPQQSNSFLSHLSLSYALQGMGRLEEARAVVHEYNSRELQMAVVLAREAELALTLGQVQTAEALVAQAQESWAANPYVVAVGGLVDLIVGRAVEAKDAFEAALRYDPKDTKSLLGLGLAEIKLGHFDAGLQKLQAANEASPNNALILTYLGRAQQQAGQTEAAQASWRSARQADPKDPTPWLYQAQAALQANRPLEARENLREAQARAAYRQVYRGENLLREDQQLLQSNLAAIQQKLGMDNLAFQTLTDPVGEKNSANLKNQADLLQGRRFGESARRSLLLQSLFDEHPGTLPAPLDIYGDGAGQTGATTPQHGAVSSLSAQQASYNNYDELFRPHTALAADATVGSKNTGGEQIRLGVGSDTLGLSLAGLQFKSDGFASFENLDNRVAQATVQWRPSDTTQLFVTRQAFHSLHGETKYPADTLWAGEYHQIDDNSGITRLGLRHRLGDNSELRGLFSSQQTNQTDNMNLIAFTPPYSAMPPYYGPEIPFPLNTWYSSSKSQGGELQYRHSGTNHDAQWGVSAVRARVDSQWGVFATIAQQAYVAWQQALNPYWQLEAGLTWGKSDLLTDWGDTRVKSWMPRMGLVYAPDSATHVRLAAWKNLDNAAVGNASLAPATLAGFVLNRPSDNRKLVRSVALGADKQLDAAWVAEGQMQRRFEDNPVITSGVQEMLSSRVDESRLALHWQPGNQALNVTLAYDDEFLHNDQASNPLDSVMRQHLRSQQLGLRWLAGSQWTANLNWSRNQFSATQQSVAFDALLNPVPVLLVVRERFTQTDASLDWQFSRAGSLDIGVRNAGGRSFGYTEIDPLVPRFSKGRMNYARLKLAW